MSNEMAIRPNETNSPDSCNNELRVWVAGELQTLRELIPGALMSDHATNIMLDALEAMAREIGAAKFHEVILKAIETCERRPTLATLRKLAGLNARLTPQDEALAKSWEVVTEVTTRYLSWDAEGNATVKSRVIQRDGSYFEEHPPHIPQSVLRAVYAMGGWKALAESFPQFWTHKFQTFKEVLMLDQHDTRLLLASSKELAVTK